MSKNQKIMNTICTSSLSNNKKAAFLLALEQFPGWKLKEIAINDPDVTPLSRFQTESTSFQKANRLLDSGETERGDILFGLQKGVTIKPGEHAFESVSLIATATALSYIGAGKAQIVHCSSNTIPLPNDIRILMENSTPQRHLYGVYKEIFGPAIENKEVPLYEFMTGKSEVAWFAELITNTLLPFIGPRKQYFQTV